ncbi:MAG TPA: acyl carrier protein [Solirubrobacteraceae bacterium]|jgi:acyl carrier protein|nr:acyl carrier protein [Solirubrobacteraceae bacterium]
MTADEQFEQDFRTVFEDVFGWGVEIDDDDGPETLEQWDSLAQIRLVHELEGRFGVRLPDSALLERQSVGSLRALVLEHAG